MEMATQALYQRALSTAVRHLSEDNRLALCIFVEDALGDVHDFKVAGRNEAEVVSRARDVVCRVQPVRFAAAGELMLSTASGESICAISVLWQDPSVHRVHRESIAYLKVGRDVRLDTKPIHGAPLTESWLD